MKCGPSEGAYNQAHSSSQSAEAKGDYCSCLAPAVCLKTSTSGHETLKTMFGIRLDRPQHTGKDRNSLSSWRTTCNQTSTAILLNLSNSLLKHVESTLYWPLHCFLWTFSYSEGDLHCDVGSSLNGLSLSPLLSQDVKMLTKTPRCVKYSEKNVYFVLLWKWICAQSSWMQAACN